MYALPSRPISKEASAATSLTFNGNSLCYQGKPVFAVPLKEALEKLLHFIESFNLSILVGHNIQNFDLPILRHHLECHKLLSQFSRDVTGFLDTLKISKKSLKNLHLPNFKQETLVNTLLGEKYDAYNAIVDVTALEKLYHSKLALSERTVCENIFNYSITHVKNL